MFRNTTSSSIESISTFTYVFAIVVISMAATSMATPANHESILEQPVSASTDDSINSDSSADIKLQSNVTQLNIEHIEEPKEESGTTKQSKEHISINVQNKSDSSSVSSNSQKSEVTIKSKNTSSDAEPNTRIEIKATENSNIEVDGEDYKVESSTEESYEVDSKEEVNIRIR